MSAKHDRYALALGQVVIESWGLPQDISIGCSKTPSSSATTDEQDESLREQLAGDDASITAACAR